MKRALSIALALVAFPAIAHAQAVESGYARGSLAVAAIERGDWARAEALLDAAQISRDDPALLINRGQVYMRTGRTAQALAAWRAALQSTRHVEVETLSGRLVSTRQIAREALARYEVAALDSR